MTEPTMIQVKAVNPRPPTAPKASKPVVHVRSVGALAGNVAAATGEAVFAVGGGVALAAVAAGAVGVPMVAAAARGRLQRSGATSSRSMTTKTSTGSAGRPGAAKTRGAGSNGGTGAGGGRLRGLLGKSGPTAGTGATGRRAASATRGPGGVSTGVGRSVRNGKPSAVGRLAKKIRQAQDRHAAKPMSQRKAAKQALKALGVKPAPGPIRRGGGWLRRKVRRTPPMPVAATPTPKAKGKKPQTVASTVKGSKAATAVISTPAPAPNPAPTAPGTPIKPTAQPVAAAGGTMSVGPASSAMRALLDVVENDMRRIANAYDPVGIEEVLAEYEKWPEVLDAIGRVWGIMVAKAEDDYPLPPAAHAVIDEIRAHQNNVARAAEAVPGLVRAIIRERLDDMTDRRNAMYDHRANPNTAAK